MNNLVDKNVTNCEKQKDLKYILHSIGIALLVLSVVAILLGYAAAVIIDETWSWAVISNSPVWGSVASLVAGIMLIMLSRFLKRSLMIWTMIICLISAWFVVFVLVVTLVEIRNQIYDFLPIPEQAEGYILKEGYYLNREDMARMQSLVLTAMALNVCIVGILIPMLVITIYAAVTLGKICKSEKNDINKLDAFPKCCYHCQILYIGTQAELPFAAFCLSKLLRHKNSDVDINHLQSLDPDFYRNLMFLRSYEGDVANLDLDFTVVDDRFGKTSVTELIPNGRNISVTNDNRVRTWAPTHIKHAGSCPMPGLDKLFSNKSVGFRGSLC